MTIRSGLPRVPGGDSWPIGGVLVVKDVLPADTVETLMESANESEVLLPKQSLETTGATPEILNLTTANAEHLDIVDSANGVPVRRGLPRVVGGDNWPHPGVAPVVVVAPEVIIDNAPEVSAINEKENLNINENSESIAFGASQPLPKRGRLRSVKSSEQAVLSPVETAKKTKQKLNPISLFFVFAGVGAIFVLAARGLTTLPGVSDFMHRFPGAYEPAMQTEEGFPVWARWSHYLNFFFMLLIVRSGLLIRYGKNSVFYQGRHKTSKKMPLNVWFHTILDLLWLANGAAFVVLLFLTGHWVRIVPTSWEVLPNALSAALRYASLEWPAENGWTNFNSLQQLMYFIVVFVASPVAAYTGLRMSQWWPTQNTVLNRLFSLGIARKIHFPTMLFFVFFVFVHVFLVFATGALRNLNHMFAGDDSLSWAGLGIFVLGFALAVSCWFAIRPVVIAILAGFTGKVSKR